MFFALSDRTLGVALANRTPPPLAHGRWVPRGTWAAESDDAHLHAIRTCQSGIGHRTRSPPRVSVAGARMRASRAETFGTGGEELLEWYLASMQKEAPTTAPMHGPDRNPLRRVPLLALQGDAVGRFALD